MLVISRKQNERIRVDGPCELVLLRNRGKRSSIGIIADQGVRILRSELAEDREPQESSDEPEAAA